jgi:hypothetical protein
MIINNSLKQAIVNKLIMNNPASNIELPQHGFKNKLELSQLKEEKKISRK